MDTSRFNRFCPTLAAAALLGLCGSQSAKGDAVDTAIAQLGDPYVWAKSGPDSFDCSGLTQYSFAQNGIAIPRNSRAQANIGTRVPVTGPFRRGDLLFFETEIPLPDNPQISHVGIFESGQTFINANGLAGAVVRNELNGWWTSRLLAVRRISSAPDPGSSEIGPVRFLRFVEGDAGRPGDGNTISRSGGNNGSTFEIAGSVGIAAALTEGLTVTVFPAPGESVPEFVDLGFGQKSTSADVRETPDDLCTVSSRADFLTTTRVNGRNGVAVFFTAERVNSLLEALEFVGCDSDISDLDFRTIGAFDTNFDRIQALDAASIGAGTNALPSSTTPVIGD